jgi:hypothetical protein
MMFVHHGEKEYKPPTPALVSGLLALIRIFQFLAASEELVTQPHTTLSEEPITQPYFVHMHCTYIHTYPHVLMDIRMRYCKIDIFPTVPDPIIFRTYIVASSVSTAPDPMIFRARVV